MSLNRTTIMGRFCADPELRATATGTSVTAFALAVDRDFKNADGNKECDFIDCVAWRNTAEFICKYFNKGKLAVVDGRLQTRTYEDKQGGKRKAVEIIVDNIYFGGTEGKNETSNNLTTDNPFVGSVEEDDDDLPF